MQIIVNGNPTGVADDLELYALIGQLGLDGQRRAAEVNEDLVPRSHFEAHRLSPGDWVEIIHAVGGG